MREKADEQNRESTGRLEGALARREKKELPLARRRRAATTSPEPARRSSSLFLSLLGGRTEEGEDGGRKLMFCQAVAERRRSCQLMGHVQCASQEYCAPTGGRAPAPARVPPTHQGRHTLAPPPPPQSDNLDFVHISRGSSRDAASSCGRSRVERLRVQYAPPECSRPVGTAARDCAELCLRLPIARRDGIGRCDSVEREGVCILFWADGAFSRTCFGFAEFKRSSVINEIEKENMHEDA